jgi:hypothetical protein
LRRGRAGGSVPGNGSGPGYSSYRGAGSGDGRKSRGREGGEATEYHLASSRSTPASTAAPRRQLHFFVDHFLRFVYREQVDDPVFFSDLARFDMPLKFPHQRTLGAHEQATLWLELGTATRTVIHVNLSSEHGYRVNDGAEWVKLAVRGIHEYFCPVPRSLRLPQ